MSEDLVKFILEQVERMKKSAEEVDDAIRLAELMGVDVSEAKAWAERIKRRIYEYELGVKTFLREKGKTV